MIQSMHKTLFTAALAATALFPLRAADGRIPISAVPFTINAPGAYYVTRDLTVASGVAVTINANNVTLDLNGHTLTNSATAAGNWVIITNVSFNGVRVTGGRVVGGNLGVELEGSSAAQLQLDHLNVSGAGAYGVNIYSSGVVPATAIVEAVQVTGPAGTAGIALQGVSGGRVSGNSTKGCYNGIQLDNSRGVIVENNTVADSTNFGIYLINGSRDNLLTGNTVQKSTSNGIYLNGSRGNRVTYNIINNNGSGISLFNANNNNVSDNALVENANYGLTLGNASNTMVTRNAIQGTQGAGHGIYLYSGSRFNSLDANFSGGNVGLGIYFIDSGSTGNTYSNNRLLNNVGGNNFGAGNISAGGNNAGAANF